MFPGGYGIPLKLKSFCCCQIGHQLLDDPLLMVARVVQTAGEIMYLVTNMDNGSRFSRSSRR